MEPGIGQQGNPAHRRLAFFASDAGTYSHGRPVGRLSRGLWRGLPGADRATGSGPGCGGVEKVLLSSGLVAALFSVEKNPHKKNSGAARCGQLPDRRLVAGGGGVVPLHGLQDRAVDKVVQAFPAALGVAFDHILLSLWHIHIDPVVILPDVLIDGFLLCF